MPRIYFEKVTRNVNFLKCKGNKKNTFDLFVTSEGKQSLNVFFCPKYYSNKLIASQKIAMSYILYAVQCYRK